MGQQWSLKIYTVKNLAVYATRHPPIKLATKVSRSASSLRPVNLSMTLPSFIAMTVGTAWTYSNRTVLPSPTPQSYQVNLLTDKTDAILDENTRAKQDSKVEQEIHQEMR